MDDEVVLVETAALPPVASRFVTQRRRRRPETTTPAFEDRRARLLAFQYQQHSLRVSASNVAAMAGCHPWKVLPELLFELVYQGTWGQLLLHADADLLGIGLVSQDDVLSNLATKAGIVDLQEVLLKAPMQTIETAATAKAKITQKASSRLNPAELKVLQEGVRTAIDTGHGIFHEDDALDLYEKQCGFTVRERNAEIRSWPFARTTDAVPLGNAEALPPLKRPKVITVDLTTTDPQDSAAPVVPAILETTPAKEEPYFMILGSVDGIRDELVPDDNDNDDSSWVLRQVIVECKHRMRRIHPTPPLYEQIQTVVYCFLYNVNDADIVQVLRSAPRQQGQKKKEGKQKKEGNQTTLDEYGVISKQVCKEETVKSKPVSSEETLHSEQFCEKEASKDEQGSEDTANSEHVCEKETSKDEQNSEETAKTEQAREEEKTSSSLTAPQQRNGTIKGATQQQLPPPIIAVSRVSLDDPITQHRSSWTNIVVPRLRSFVDAVYAIRSSDDLRYRLLMASTSDPMNGQETTMEQAWSLLHEQCPWLKDCDTAFYRK
jgi:hypothetical protein